MFDFQKIHDQQAQDSEASVRKYFAERDQAKETPTVLDSPHQQHNNGLARYQAKEAVDRMNQLGEYFKARRQK